MGSQRVGHDWETSLPLFTFMHWRRKWQPAWRIPGTSEPGGLPSMGSRRVGYDWRDLAAAAAAVIRSLRENQIKVTIDTIIAIFESSFLKGVCQLSKMSLYFHINSSLSIVTKQEIKMNTFWVPNDISFNICIFNYIVLFTKVSSPGDLPNPGIKPGSPTLQADSLPSEPLEKLY